MPKVTNKTDRAVVLGNWRVLPNSSKVVDRMGHIYDQLPAEVAYSVKAKQLAGLFVLDLEGYTSTPKAVVPTPPKIAAPAPPPEVKVADAPSVEAPKPQFTSHKRRSGKRDLDEGR